MVSSIERFHCIQDSQLGPNGVLYREVPLYTYLHDVCAFITITMHVIVCDSSHRRKAKNDSTAAAGVSIM